MTTLEQIDEKLDRVENTMIEVKTVLLGKNSDKGLVGQVSDHEKKITRLQITVAAVVAGGGGIYGLIKLLT